jgi:hypothetical protein
LRFFAFASVRPSFGLEIRTPPARVMHRRFLTGRCSATRVTGHFAAWPGLAVPAALMGLRPFAVLLLPAGVGRFRLSGPLAVS